jgi:hypothetical protein
MYRWEVVRIRKTKKAGYDQDMPTIRWWSVCVRHTNGMAVGATYHKIAHDQEVKKTPWIDTETGCCFESLGELLEYVVEGTYTEVRHAF